MREARRDIVLLAGRGPTTDIIYNHLCQRFGPLRVLIEQPVPRFAIMRRRARRLGLAAALSQSAFVLLIRPLLDRRDNGVIETRCRDLGLDRRPIDPRNLTRIPSVNSEECRRLLAEIQPRVVVVNGTRIIARETLHIIDARFINTHLGITPLYRGAHGGYWALQQRDAGNFGVTIHLVDEGVDTGNVISQARATPSPEDSFVTYPFVQIAAGLPLLEAAITAALDGTLEVAPATGPSRIWYHPGVLQYIAGALRGIH